MSEASHIKIEEHAITFKNLPQAFDGIKIAHLTDIHSRRFGGREKEVLRILEELNPDFIFITGDFIDPVARIIIDRDLNLMKTFWQRLGEKYKGKVFGVLGNHDGRKIKNCLQEKGIFLLNNENKRLSLGGEFIFLVGVDDPATGRDDLSKAMGGTEENQSKILLAHDQEIIDEAVKKRIDLVLVGHTHGGQVNIPFVRNLVYLLPKYRYKRMAGLFKLNSTYLYVNRGIGTPFLSFRINSPPEIAFIELKR